MCEIIASHYCKKEQKRTEHMFGGSGKNGSCCECGNKLPPEEKCNWKDVICSPYEENEWNVQYEICKFPIQMKLRFKKSGWR